ncbi:DUF4956 domain-containing protein [Niameybacter massiliensis]|uniref:DUF4956 domain-containing protein n=1 Tax=Niameybacter massiliensis TaxID=1658108 RepID=UPI0006B62CC0|nr:DUF4956 domain-containing protein [Niameybacter massiliensis]
MKEYLQNVLEQSGTLGLEEIIMYIVAAALISSAIYISYWYTHSGTTYSQKFNVSLVTLTILTATVMTVIGNNVALSLGMVGALSIVRFRTAIKDSRDTTYIFWAITVGICCGVGDFVVAGIGTAVTFVVLLCLGRVRNENRILLIVRGSFIKEREIESIIFSYFKGKAVQRVKNTTPSHIELIFEMSKKVYHLSYQQETSIAEKLYGLGDIEYVNIVTQSDEISG